MWTGCAMPEKMASKADIISSSLAKPFSVSSFEECLLLEADLLWVGYEDLRGGVQR